MMSEILIIINRDNILYIPTRNPSKITKFTPIVEDIPTTKIKNSN